MTSGNNNLFQKLRLTFPWRPYFGLPLDEAINTITQNDGVNWLTALDKLRNSYMAPEKQKFELAFIEEMKMIERDEKTKSFSETFALWSEIARQPSWDLRQGNGDYAESLADDPNFVVWISSWIADGCPKDKTYLSPNAEDNIDKIFVKGYGYQEK